MADPRIRQNPERNKRFFGSLTHQHESVNDDAPTPPTAPFFAANSKFLHNL